MTGSGKNAVTVNYAYNSDGRLSGVGAAAFKYDAAGRRAVETGGAAHFLFSAEGALLAEHTAQGALVRNYIYLNGAPFATVDTTGAVRYILNDHLGQPQEMLDAAGAVTWRRVAGLFGDTVSQPVGNTSDNPLRFPGQQFDAATGLHYNYFRNYDPLTGRYLEPDPIGLAGGVNLYAYAGSNPMNYVDPYGLVGFPNFANFARNAAAAAAAAACEAISNPIVQSAIEGAVGGAVSGALSAGPGGALSGAAVGGAVGAAAGAATEYSSSFGRPAAAAIGAGAEIVSGGRTGGAVGGAVGGAIGGVGGGAVGGSIGGAIQGGLNAKASGILPKGGLGREITSQALEKGTVGGLAGLAGAGASALVGAGLDAAAEQCKECTVD